MQDDDFGLCAAHFHPFSFLGATVLGPLDMVAPIAPFSSSSHLFVWFRSSCSFDTPDPFFFVYFPPS
jgi:hypothetical protein